MKTQCTNPVCGREFVATQRYLNTAGGLCRSCASAAQSVERTCVDCQGTFLEYPRFLRNVGAFAGVRIRCPSCHDKKEGKAPENIVTHRECLQYFPVVQVMVDLENAERIPNTGVSGRPSVKAIFKNFAHAVREGYVTLYDVRVDGQRGAGSLALVRVMKVRHEAGILVAPATDGLEEFRQNPEFEYLVLEPVDNVDACREPEGKLVLVDWFVDEEHRGELVENNSLWSAPFSSSARESEGSGKAHSLMAIVSEEHTVKVLQDGEDIVHS